MGFLRRDKSPRDPDVREVPPGEPVLARWGLQVPGRARYWVLDGQDGRPVGAARLVPHPDDPRAAEVWVYVEPVVRRFGSGQRLWLQAEGRARRDGITTVTSWAADPDGASFLAWHGFEPTGQDEDEHGRPRAHGRLELA